jgi:phospholipase A1
MARPSTSLRPLLAVSLLAAALPPLSAQEFQRAEPASLEACAALDSDPARLACYDRLAGRSPEQAAAVAAQEAEEAAAYDALDARLRPDAVRNEAEENVAEALSARALSSLDKRWELSRESKLGTFNLRAYKPVYLLPWTWSSQPNRLPTSPNPDNRVDAPLDLQPAEAEFQLSLKTKVAQGLLFGEGDLWFGYTQSSRWQIFNSETSRPFRETVYEPEALLVFGPKARLLGWDLRLLSVGVNHQSNGRSLPLSRSWNRVTAAFGFEREGWQLQVRPWWRISEDRATDDNPDISDYLGRGDVNLVHRRGEHEFALLLRHSLRSGADSRGAAQFDWSFPISRSLRGHVQVFEGYGESLIDYNVRSTQVGLGISLFEWF